MASTQKVIKCGFSVVMAVLLLCTMMSSSVLAEDLTASTAQNDLLEAASPVTCNNTGVFENETMTVWGLCDHATIEHYLTLFDDDETVQKIEILKNGEVQTSGYLENDMVVRMHQNEDDYLDYTVVGMDTAIQSVNTETVQSTKTNSRSVTNPYGFILPLDGMNLIDIDDGGHITSPFGLRDGKMHNGIDIAWKYDMTDVPIKAVLGGTASVLSQGVDKGYGHYVVVNHGTVGGVQLKTLYAHMSSHAISDGAIVTQGTVLGYVGNTGNSSGDHLHFEVIINGTEVDPIPYLTGAGNAAPSGNPVGNLESVVAKPASVRIQGWAYDPDRPATSIYIHVYIGGPAGSAGAIGYDVGATNLTDADINTEYDITGAHGFDKTISTTKRGTQDVYVYAINVDIGEHTLLGHSTVTIPTGNPIASYDGAVGGKGTVRVYGWAFDYDKPSTSIYIHMYIGGPAGSANAVGYDIGATNITRSDVNSIYGITGKHGFDKTISTNVKGTVRVYLYAINVGNGTNKSMGSFEVTIT